MVTTKEEFQCQSFSQVDPKRKSEAWPQLYEKKKDTVYTHVTKKTVIIPEIRMKLYLRNSKEKAAATIRITKDHLTCF